MAKRFKFRLEAVRTLRQRAEDAQRRIVAAAVRKAALARRRVDDLAVQYAETLRKLREIQEAGPLNLGAVRENQWHRAWLEREGHAAAAQLAQADAELTSEREMLAETAKQRKVIEKLRERRWNQHRQSVQREEQKALDETAVQAVTRQKRNVSLEGGA